jgi:hypothetical protein
LRLEPTEGSVALADVALIVDDKPGEDATSHFMPDYPEWLYGQRFDEEDIRSPVQTIAPASKTNVNMLSEEVRMVPYLDSRFGDQPMVMVDARWELENPGKAQALLVELPEMVATREAWNSDAELCCKAVSEERSTSEPSDGTFDDFSAEVDGVAAPVASNSSRVPHGLGCRGLAPFIVTPAYNAIVLLNAARVPSTSIDGLELSWWGGRLAESVPPPTHNGSPRPQPASVSEASRDLFELSGRRRCGVVFVPPPTHNGSVGSQPAGVEAARRNREESFSRRRRLAVVGC